MASSNYSIRFLKTKRFSTINIDVVELKSFLLPNVTVNNGTIEYLEDVRMDNYIVNPPTLIRSSKSNLIPRQAKSSILDTEIVCTTFNDRHFVVITQLKKFGSLVSFKNYQLVTLIDFVYRLKLTLKT